MAVVSGATLLLVIAAAIYFGYRSPEMSEKGLKHFRLGLLFAVISSLLSFGFWLSASHLQLLWAWVRLGNISNAVAVLCFFRELIQLIPG